MKVVAVGEIIETDKEVEDDDDDDFDLCFLCFFCFCGTEPFPLSSQSFQF